MSHDHLEGAIDLHVHSSPDVDPRRFNDIELAQEAARAGMGALLIKSHQSSTVERAYLVSQVVSGIQVFGGIVLNETVGGFNPAAVELALKLGAREVWMPTRSAENHRTFHGHGGTLRALDSEGNIIPELEAILRNIAASNCLLGTGHLSPDEATVVINRALELGVKRIVVTHPEWAGTLYSIEQQKQLAARGVAFERCFVSMTHRCGFVPLQTISNAIAEVGVESTVIATDLGQPDTPPPVEGLRIYSEKLLSEGFNADQIRQMMHVNPARLLGL